MSGQALWDRIARNKARRRRIRAVRNRISSNNLNRSRESDLAHMVGYIDENKSTVNTIEGDRGYDYLSTFAHKLNQRMIDLDEFIEFARDSIRSFTEMDETLGQEQQHLTALIEQDVAAYNADRDNFFSRRASANDNFRP